jgi:hypothetical protein
MPETAKGKAKELCQMEYRDKAFNFKMFPWNRTGVDVDPFTIVVFGDMGLMKEAAKPQVRFNFFYKAI